MPNGKHQGVGGEESENSPRKKKIYSDDEKFLKLFSWGSLQVGNIIIFSFQHEFKYILPYLTILLQIL